MPVLAWLIGGLHVAAIALGCFAVHTPAPPAPSRRLVCLSGRPAPRDPSPLRRFFVPFHANQMRMRLGAVAIIVAIIP